MKKNENEAEKAENENLVDEKTAETRNELLSAWHFIFEIKFEINKENFKTVINKDN